MSGFLEALKEKVLLFDGGMGSMLIAAGLGEGEAPDVWSITRSEVLIDIHKKYLGAGADVIQTNTFGGTSIKLKASCRGEAPDASALNRRAAEIARQAIDEFGRAGRFLAGDIGPTGEFFPPMGTLSVEAARTAFREQAAALEKGGVDLYLIETMYDIREAAEAIRAVKEVSDKPIVCELTMDRKKKGYFTIVGNSPAEAAETLVAEGAAVIGANCSITSGEMLDLVGEMRALTDVPLLFQPNAGLPAFSDGKAVYGQKPEEFAADLVKMIESGANAVGGCCGTTPDFIKAVRASIDGM
jgi:5-methyltetrahydrofolate--homocysteine methyltransferase